ncbi:hypothetical protein X772_24485 [Mesorhizobium sp. LSJC280B00]|nr:hypothetical protein X772_24485 [Mesorhizobium sp. LSJC280B00]
MAAGARVRATGTALQDIELFSGCVRDNIARFRADAADAQVIEAATHASAHEMIPAPPQRIYDRHRGGWSRPVGRAAATGRSRARSAKEELPDTWFHINIAKVRSEQVKCILSSLSTACQHFAKLHDKSTT